MLQYQPTVLAMWVNGCGSAEVKQGRYGSYYATCNDRPELLASGLTAEQALEHLEYLALRTQPTRHYP